MLLPSTAPAVGTAIWCWLVEALRTSGFGMSGSSSIASKHIAAGLVYPVESIHSSGVEKGGACLPEVDV